ncbi:hypothetical protein KFL_002040030 [Klebsormidium nitens]|uniref:Uncharacterized protein n=1 Tax=Klebsormidium nitens TaxID=105231 RepID=A0A1Y1I1F8_KLENI|nr:hypothetical protein KFL_002040030 [Klebsormidium nitens]|eukprot:GAQ84744.1 hypothetical protein KFL_002040030 [Klebsormidium nitens]
MGYDTKFTGRFALSRPLTAEESAILKAVQDYRPEDGLKLPSAVPGQERPIKILREGVDPYCNGEGWHIFKEFPSCKCRWTVSHDKSALVWDGKGPFYNHVSWLEYFISNFFEVWGVRLSGTVTLEDNLSGDTGSITLNGNQIFVKMAPPIALCIGDDSYDYPNEAFFDYTARRNYCTHRRRDLCRSGARLAGRMRVDVEKARLQQDSKRMKAVHDRRYQDDLELPYVAFEKRPSSGLTTSVAAERGRVGGCGSLVKGAGSCKAARRRGA